MHFVGMSAVTMQDENGNEVEVRYDTGLTLLSLALVLVFATVGFWISAKDIMFVKSKREIFELIVSGASTMTMQSAQHITPLQLLIIIGTYAPQHLVGGGICAGSGVIVMHYVGMAAMKFPGRIVWDVGTIVGSCIIAFTAATAAFWILFRFLSTYTNREDLRLLSALLMAIAVCGMHYTGMVAAEFTLDSSVTIPHHTTMSVDDAFNAGVVVACCVSFVAAVIAFEDLRRTVAKLSYELGRADETIMHLPAGANSICLSHIQRYINKRKASNCSLGILNQTAVFETDNDDSSNHSVSYSRHYGGGNISSMVASPRSTSGISRRRVHVDVVPDPELGEPPLLMEDVHSAAPEEGKDARPKPPTIATTASATTIGTAVVSHREMAALTGMSAEFSYDQPDQP